MRQFVIYFVNAGRIDQLTQVKVYKYNTLNERHLYQTFEYNTSDRFYVGIFGQFPVFSFFSF